MSERSNLNRYSPVAVTLHWVVAIAIGFNLYYGLGFDDLEKLHPDQLRSAIDLHKSIGITVLGLVILRLLWRFSHPAPPPLPSLKPWERKLSVGTHHLIYLLIVVVPLAGWLHDSAWIGAATHPLVLFGTIPWFRLPLFGGLSAAALDHWHNALGGAHAITAKILIGALALHVAGALKHQFLDREKSLQRMWYGR